MVNNNTCPGLPLLEPTVVSCVKGLDPSMQSTQNDGCSNPVVFMSNTVPPNKYVGLWPGLRHARPIIPLIFFTCENAVIQEWM